MPRTRVVYDLSTKPKTRTVMDVTNEWLLAHKPNTLHLTADKTTIDAGGVDYATISVQLKTPRLIDDSYDNTTPDPTADYTVLVDEEETIVELDGAGAGAFEVDSDETGAFAVRGKSHDSPVIIEMEAV